MNIYLCDHDYDRETKSDWHRALEIAFGRVFLARMTKGWNEPEADHPAYQDRDAVLFVHSNAGEPEWREKANEVGIHCHFILVRSAGGQPPERNEKGNLHGCYWPPGEFEAKARSEIARLVEQMIAFRRDSGPASEQPGLAAAHPEGFARSVGGDEERAACRADHRIDWELLERPSTEELLAMRLLCEAKHVCGAEGSGELDGIAIRAPMTLQEWLAPFGKREAKDIEEVASMIGGGDIKAKAQAVLDAVRKNGDVQGAVSGFLAAMPHGG